MRVVGRATFQNSQPLRRFAQEMIERGCREFVMDLAECRGMDSTFLGVLAEFGLKISPTDAPEPRGIELLNPNPRITELLENLGALHLFKVVTGELQLPDDVQTCMPESIHPTHEQITRTSLEAHQTLMAVNPENVAKFKDVTQFLAEDLKNLEKNT